MATGDAGSVLAAMMGGGGAAQQIVCNSCQCVVDDAARQDHYRSEWHRYNIKRRVHNLPPITNDVFQQKLAALNEQKTAEAKEKDGAKCTLCGNSFQSQKAYENHLASKKHLKKLEKKNHSQSQAQSVAPSQAATPLAGPSAGSQAAAAAVPAVALTPAATSSTAAAAPAAAAVASASTSTATASAKPKANAATTAAAGGVAPVRKAVKPKSAAGAGPDSKGDDAEDDSELAGYNPADALPLGTCLFCSKFFAEKPQKPAKAAATAAATPAAKPSDAAQKEANEKTAPAAAAPKAAAATATAAADSDGEPKGDVEAVLEHMAKAHGFFIPYVEFCTDVNGLIGYLGAKVGMGRVCLYCDGRGRSRYPTIQAVEQHMVAKGHCKIRFEENDVDEEVLDFYDFPDRDGDGEGEDDDDTAADAKADRKSAAASAAGALITVDDGKGKQLTTVGGGAGGAPKRTVAEVNEHGELILSDGSVIGHRNLKRYYSQNTRPRETRESVLINQLVSKYKLLALPGYSASGVVTPQMKKAQKEARKRQGAYNEKVGTNSNLLIRKFFRVQTSL